MSALKTLYSWDSPDDRKMSRFIDAVPLHAALAKGGLGSLLSGCVYYKHTLEREPERDGCRYELVGLTPLGSLVVQVSIHTNEWACEANLYDPTIGRMRPAHEVMWCPVPDFNWTSEGKHGFPIETEEERERKYAEWTSAGHPGFPPATLRPLDQEDFVSLIMGVTRRGMGWITGE